MNWILKKISKKKKQKSKTKKQNKWSERREMTFGALRYDTFTLGPAIIKCWSVFFCLFDFVSAFLKQRWKASIGLLSHRFNHSISHTKQTSSAKHVSPYCRRKKKSFIHEGLHKQDFCIWISKPNVFQVSFFIFLLSLFRRIGKSKSHDLRETFSSYFWFTYWWIDVIYCFRCFLFGSVGLGLSFFCYLLSVEHLTQVMWCGKIAGGKRWPWWCWGPHSTMWRIERDL